MNELKLIPQYLWVILAAAALTQGCWIFMDASRRGEHKWLWGFFGLLNIPSNLIIYLLVTRVIMKPNPCPHCKKNVRGSFAFCPHCGEKIGEQNT